MSIPPETTTVKVRGVELLPDDSREQYRQKLARITLDSMVQFVGLLDAEGTVLEINQVALDGGGLRLADVEGRKFWTTFWWGVSEDIQGVLRDGIRRAALGEFVRWDTLIYGRAEGTETIVIDASLCPVWDESGKVAFITAEGRDITEKKAQERELAEKNAELEVLLERIKELDKIKTQFFANISHEFRTPLTLMLGPLSEVLMQNPELPPHVRREIEVAQRNGERLLKLVNTLLDFSRIEAGRVQAVFQQTDIAVLTSELASVFRSTMEKVGLRFEVDSPNIDAPVFVDREMWEKIVLNLLSNAYKYTFEGTVSLRLGERDGQIILEVEDSGVGIPEHELPHLFERFHRVESTQGRTHEGTGIGLSLVRELVKFHGGTVAVESTLGKGTKFTITIPSGSAHLPADRIGAAAQLSSTASKAEVYIADRPEAVVREAPKTAGARILLADDNADMRDYIVRLLAEHWNVETARDGAEALSKAQANPPDLVLTDVMMPKLDGFGLLRELRADPSTHAIPIIMLSARAGEESRVEGVEAGADDYLVKPFSARELVARVGAHLELARVRADAAAKEKTHRQEAELLLEELKDARTRLDSTLEAGLVATWVWDIPRDRVVADCNLQTLFSIADVDAKGSSIENYIKAMHADDRDRFRTTLEQALQYGDRFEAEYRIVQKDESVRSVTARGRVDRNPEGQALTLAGVIVDITERKAAEAERESLLADLKAADQRKDEFLAVLSHELRSPLNVIGGHAELLRMEEAGTPEFEESLEAIERNTRTQTQLIDDLLDISRIVTGKFLLDVRTFDLESVLEAALDSVRFAADAKGIPLVLETTSDLGLFVGDATRIQQIVWNLLSNAIKFTPKGGLVRLSARRMPAHIEIALTDSGEGINPEFLPHVFDRFHQEDASKSRKYGGLGLGLAIVRHIAEMHGGTVRAESAGKNQGSTFTIVLPERDPADLQNDDDAEGFYTRTDGPHALDLKPLLSGLGALVVDDQEDAREMVGKVFHHLGASVTLAASSADGLQLLACNRFDVIFCDIGMPGMNGIEFIKKWRVLERERRLRFTPAVALTAYANELDRLEFMEAGFQRHLPKPVNMTELSRMTAELCGRRGAMN